MATLDIKIEAWLKWWAWPVILTCYVLRLAVPTWVVGFRVVK